MKRKENKRVQNLTKIPKLRFNLEKIADAAEMRGLYVVESQVKSLIYVCEGRKILILTGSGGYLLGDLDKVEAMANELIDIVADLRWRMTVVSRKKKNQISFKGGEEQ